jgi:hypothetical protein
MKKISFFSIAIVFAGVGCSRNIVSPTPTAVTPQPPAHKENRIQANGFSFVLSDGLIAVKLPFVDMAHVDDERLEVMEGGQRSGTFNNVYGTTTLKITEDLTTSSSWEQSESIFKQYLGPAYTKLKGYSVTTQTISANNFDTGKWLPAPENLRVVSYIKGPEKSEMQYYVIEPCKHCGILIFSVYPLSDIAKDVPAIIKSLDYTYATA